MNIYTPTQHSSSRTELKFTTVCFQNEHYLNITLITGVLYKYVAVCNAVKTKKTKLRGLSRQTKYTDRATTENKTEPKYFECQMITC
jgi:hypothetical protein